LEHPRKITFSEEGYPEKQQNRDSLNYSIMEVEEKFLEVEAVIKDNIEGGEHGLRDY
jgi:hypothetical protein